VKRRTRLLWLYPRRWRGRYGAEFDALIEDLGASPAVWIDVFLAAVRAHLDLGARSRARLVSGPPGGIDPRGGAGMLVIKFIAAVLVGGIVIALVLLSPFPAIYQLIPWPFLQPLLLLIVAVTIGALAERRAWLAAGCAYLAGVTMWLAWLRPQAGWMPLPPTPWAGWALLPSTGWPPSDSWFTTMFIYMDKPSYEVLLKFVLPNVLVGALTFALAAAAAHLVARAVRQRALRTN
jgi:hypothetical protein